MSTAEARSYDRALWFLERAGLGSLRRNLLAEVTGTVLEIGVGTGVNLPLYRNGRTVHGVDNNAGRLAGAVLRQTRAPATATCADVQVLPYPNGAFDTVVSTLVFCSIPDPLQALNEIKRVMRPGGRLLMLEHVRGLGPVSRRLTDWLHPMWFALQGECHLNRETAETVRNAGFHITETSTHGRGVLQIIKAQPAG